VPLCSVPLSASDRQLLTDARVAKGLSQSELASQAGGSLGFMHAIESEKKSPSPDLMDQMCKALGFQWRCKFQLAISHNVTRRSRRWLRVQYSAIIYWRQPDDGTLENLPRGATPVEHPVSTCVHTDGGIGTSLHIVRPRTAT
jgi:transcriptional regulator with XRE-family HTH domain